MCVPGRYWANGTEEKRRRSKREKGLYAVGWDCNRVGCYCAISIARSHKRLVVKNTIWSARFHPFCKFATNIS